MTDAKKLSPAEELRRLIEATRAGQGEKVLVPLALAERLVIAARGGMPPRFPGSKR